MSASSATSINEHGKDLQNIIDKRNVCSCSLAACRWLHFSRSNAASTRQTVQSAATTTLDLLGSKIHSIVSWLMISLQSTSLLQPPSNSPSPNWSICWQTLVELTALLLQHPNYTHRFQFTHNQFPASLKMTSSVRHVYRIISCGIGRAGA
jgi:hypothetical protein